MGRFLKQYTAIHDIVTQHFLCVHCVLIVLVQVSWLLGSIKWLGKWKESRLPQNHDLHSLAVWDAYTLPLSAEYREWEKASTTYLVTRGTTSPIIFYNGSCHSKDNLDAMTQNVCHLITSKVGNHLEGKPQAVFLCERFLQDNKNIACLYNLI